MQDVVGASAPVGVWRVIPQRVTRWALAAIAGFGMSTLVLSMAGMMFPWLAWPIGLAATVGVGLLLPDGNETPAPVTGYLILALAAITVTVGWIAPHEHILGARDPGTYVATATSLARSGNLLIETDADLFGEAPVRFTSPGFDATSDGQRLYPQFMHLFPGLLALTAATFGQAALFLVNPVIAATALLALYACLRGLLSARLALLSCLLVAASLPFLYFGRAPFSEMASMAFVFGGLWAARTAIEKRSPRYATGAGLLLGAVFVARIDGLLVILALTIYLTWVEVGGNLPEWHGLLRRVWAVACLTALLGLVDGLLFSPVYIANHAEFIGGGLAALLVIRVIGAMLGRSGPLSLVARHRAQISRWLTFGVGAWLVYAWILRPGIESPTRSDIYGLAGLQDQAGVAIDPLRTYAELSVQWQVWYLGVPIVALGLIGLVLKLRSLTAGAENGEGLFVTVVAVTTLTYLFRPSINPDHVWAMRRFVPIVLPGVIALGVWVLSRLLERLDGWKHLAALVAATAVLAAPVVIHTARLGLAAEFEGGGQAAIETCEAMGPNAVLVMVGEAARSGGDLLMPLVRGWCGVPAAAEMAESLMNGAVLEGLADRVRSRGLDLWVVGDAPETEIPIGLLDQPFQYVEVTLFSTPRRWAELNVGFTAWEAGS
ncbi:MAG: glycosyltransferase family 39 protein [Acidimicrobiia bacterium]